MSPQLYRLLFVAGIAILVGGFIGSYATRSIYGDTTESVHPVALRDKICPPCECPLCPPPPDCGENGLVPTSTAPKAILVPDGEDPDRERKHGLPATAIRLASDRIKAEITACLEEAKKEGAHGIVLLDITVTATGSEAFISDTAVLERSGDARSSSMVEACLVDSAKRARFDWDAEDGEAHFRMPVKLD